MAASFQSKDSAVLAQQLKVEELCLFAGNSLITVVGGDLVVQLNEPVDQIYMTIKQVVAGTISGIHSTIGGDGTSIVITGESAAVATTSYCIKYSMKQS